MKKIATTEKGKVLVEMSEGEHTTLEGLASGKRLNVKPTKI